VLTLLLVRSTPRVATRSALDRSRTPALAS
jgi:hypothetical protein